MRINVKNLTNGLDVDFYHIEDFAKQFGIENTLLSCYPGSVNRTNSYIMFDDFGFFNNNKVNPFVTVGHNDDGVSFKSNNFDGTIVSWAFQPVFDNINNPLGFSPQNVLNTLILAKNDTLEVTVYTDLKEFKNTFFVQSETVTENGIIVLESALPGDRIFWDGGSFEEIFYFFEFDKPYITKNLPQVLLNEKNYPFKMNIPSLVETGCSIKIGGRKTTGVWNETNMVNTLTGEQFTYTNSENDEYVIVDSENLTVTNEFGDDRQAYFTGDFINLSAGVNPLEWTVNGNDYDVSEKGLPLDMSCQIEYTKFYPGIE